MADTPEEIAERYDLCTISETLSTPVAAALREFVVAKSTDAESLIGNDPERCRRFVGLILDYQKAYEQALYIDGLRNGSTPVIA